MKKTKLVSFDGENSSVSFEIEGAGLHKRLTVAGTSYADSNKVFSSSVSFDLTNTIIDQLLVLLNLAKNN